MKLAGEILYALSFALCPTMRFVDLIKQKWCSPYGDDDVSRRKILTEIPWRGIVMVCCIVIASIFSLEVLVRYAVIIAPAELIL